MARPGYRELPAERGEGLRRRVEELSRGQDAGAVAAAGDQDPAIREHRRRVIPAWREQTVGEQRERPGFGIIGRLEDHDRLGIEPFGGAQGAGILSARNQHAAVEQERRRVAGAQHLDVGRQLPKRLGTRVEHLSAEEQAEAVLARDQQGLGLRQECRRVLGARGRQGVRERGRAQRHGVEQLGGVQDARGASPTSEQHVAARKERGRMPRARLGEGPRGGCAERRPKPGLAGRRVKIDPQADGVVVAGALRVIRVGPDPREDFERELIAGAVEVGRRERAERDERFLGQGRIARHPGNTAS